MAKSNLFSALSHCPLFRGIDAESMNALLPEEAVLCKTFSAGEEIPLTYGTERALVILTDGLAIAYSVDTERSVILRTIPPGTAFGVSILFSDEPPVSVIRAKTASAAVILPSSSVQALIASSPVFRMNYIAFLSGRIRFLNRRIACYTAGSAERRLALYLAELPEFEPGIVRLDTPLTDLCEILDIGRASLYRAFQRLSDSRLIEREDRRIRILDRAGLLRYGAPNEP